MPPDPLEPVDLRIELHGRHLPLFRKRWFHPPPWTKFPNEGLME